MPDFVPHTEADFNEMVQFLEIYELSNLFSSIPENLRLTEPLKIPNGISEFEVKQEIKKIASKNKYSEDFVSFAGFGSYDHYIPAVTKALASQSEFLTAYTPYQPEVAQGVLQALFEYQSLINRLTALEVTNASLYDGANALSEAVHMACIIKSKQTVLVSEGIHPNWRKVLSTVAFGTGHKITLLPLKDGLTQFETTQTNDISAVVVGYPNYLGAIEDLDNAKVLADSLNALLIVAYDPIALGLLKAPGHYGVDIAVCEGQPLGIEMSFGGPYLGVLSCKFDYIRRVPGRIVGKTIDQDGKDAYVTTLRTREQDIRREKASSNVCTNQTVLAIQAAIQLCWLGPSGLRALAGRCLSAANYLKKKLSEIKAVKALPVHTFREFSVDLPVSADDFISEMLNYGYLAGVSLGPYGFLNRVLLTTNEKHTKQDIDNFVRVTERILK
jgi:glycine dehydrogenase subunit 1